MVNVLGPFGEAPVETLSEPASDSPVPRVWTVDTRKIKIFIRAVYY